jgi:tripartite-type tricarboxylate transporter receptor subunit TctC
MKKALAMILALGLIVGLTACSQTGGAGKSESPAAGKYPTGNINGIVQWGAGGGTDSLMRPLAALAESKLGVSIVIQNMTGATGSIATQYVYDAAADGYNLLMGAENAPLYKVLEISDLTYEDFECVFLIGDETVGICVGPDSPYESFTDIIDAALAAPGEIKISTTGKGGLPWEVGAFITDITGATFNQIPYDSDASAKTAVQSGECDFTVCKVQSGIESYKASEIKFLTMLSLEPVESMPEVPVITEEYPDFEKYLPWGPFYGVFVKNGTDPAAIKTLGDAFKEASTDETYSDVLKNFNINYLGYTGEEADEYIANWQRNTINALKSSGAIE